MATDEDDATPPLTGLILPAVLFEVSGHKHPRPLADRVLEMFLVPHFHGHEEGPIALIAADGKLYQGLVIEMKNFDIGAFH